MGSEAAPVQVRVNGKDRSVSPGLTVQTLLESLELHPGMVVVEMNREILARDSYGSVAVKEGDSFELVHFVGGG